MHSIFLLGNLAAYKLRSLVNLSSNLSTKARPIGVVSLLRRSHYHEVPVTVTARDCTTSVTMAPSVPPVLGVEILPSPDKSKFSHKEFRTLRLDNGMHVVLVSDHYREGEVEDADEEKDEETGDEEEEEGDDEEGDYEGDEEEDDAMTGDEGDEEDEEMRPKKKKKTSTPYKAAAAMSVCCGSREDPVDVQGLMHLLEHMVFMGSEKYPKENSFDDFVNRHGGCTNAFTDDEHTNFHFDIHSTYLWESLDMWAQFFIAPLINKEALEREIQAVDSEFTEAMPSDSSRRAVLYCSLAPEGHPANIFTYGNQKSLGLDFEKLFAKLHEYRRRLYSSQHMRLVVQARQPLDIMEENIVRIFSEVPNNGLPMPDYSTQPFPYPPERINKYIRMEALKAKNCLELNWFLKPMGNLYKSQPYRFLMTLMGHEGHGSLLSYFKKKDWACGLEADSDMESYGRNSLYCYYSLNMELTDEGFDHIPDVIAAIFQYIGQLKNNPPSQKMFDEFKALSKLNFDYETEPDSMMYVEGMASAMTLYEPQDYITGNICLYEYDVELMKEALNFLNPDNVSICLTSKKCDDFGGADTLVEKWFGTRYKIQDISPEWRHQFNAAYNEPNPALHLPGPNQYLITDAPSFDSCWPRDVVSYPTALVNDPVLGSVHHEALHNYGLPYADVRVMFQFQDTPRHNTKQFKLAVKMVLKCVSYHLIEEAYDADVAKFSYSLYYCTNGVSLLMSGFPQHMGRYIKMILDHLRHFSTHFNSTYFDSVKNLYVKKTYNQATNPSELQNNLRLITLVPEELPILDQIPGLHKVTQQDVLDAAKDILKNVQVKMLVQGNTSDSEARSYFAIVQEYVERDGGKHPVMGEAGYRVLPCGSSVLRVAPVNASNGNSSVTNYYQGPRGTLKQQVLNEYIACSIEERCFDILRTKEQLSYLVSSVARETNGITGFSIRVDPQAFKFTVEHVDSRIDTFLRSFGEELSKLSDDAFATLRETMVNMKKTFDESLQDEASRNWNEITTGELLFDRMERHIPLIQATTKSEVVDFYHSMVDPSSANYRKFSIQVQGHSKHTEHRPPPLEELIEKGSSYIQLQPQPIAMSSETPPTAMTSETPPTAMTSETQPQVASPAIEAHYVLDFNKFVNDLQKHPCHKIVE